MARFKDDVFVTVTKGLPAGASITDLAAGPGGELWVATDKGLFAGSEAAGFHPVPGWTDASAQAVFFAPRSGRVWAVGTEDLWRLDPGGSWTVIDPGGAASKDGLERAFEDDQGRVWIRTLSYLWELDPAVAKPRRAEPLYRSEHEISRMYQDPGGVVWAPNETGLARLEKGRWTQWEAQDGLPTDFARAVLVDHEGSLWVGGLGLFRIIGRGAWRSATPNEGLPAPVWSFLRTDDGTLLVGTQKGLARMTSHGWAVVPGTRGPMCPGPVPFALRDRLLDGRTGADPGLGSPDRTGHGLAPASREMPLGLRDPLRRRRPALDRDVRCRADVRAQERRELADGGRGLARRLRQRSRVWPHP